ncbi:MAG: VRR-NUC domain-containing protein [Prolixibacteraceae bacterium]
MNEKLIEKKLRESVKKLGGLALKFSSMTYTGMPDRIVLMPGARVSFAEIKTTGKKPSPRQRIVITLLRRLGFKVGLLDSQESLDKFLEEIENEI